MSLPLGAPLGAPLGLLLGAVLLLTLVWLVVRVCQWLDAVKAWMRAAERRLAEVEERVTGRL